MAKNGLMSNSKYIKQKWQENYMDTPKEKQKKLRISVSEHGYTEVTRKEKQNLS